VLAVKLALEPRQCFVGGPIRISGGTEPGAASLIAPGRQVPIAQGPIVPALHGACLWLPAADARPVSPRAEGACSAAQPA
jgi:hypothetical protein